MKYILIEKLIIYLISLISFIRANLFNYIIQIGISYGLMIAESPINARLENAQKHIVADLAGQVYFLDLTVEEVRAECIMLRG